MSRMLRETTAVEISSESDARAFAYIIAAVRNARSRCEYDGGLWGVHYPTARRYRRTMEDAKQTVRRAEIVLAAWRDGAANET
jgi:hypothetical protein